MSFSSVLRNPALHSHAVKGQFGPILRVFVAFSPRSIKRSVPMTPGK